MRPSSSVGPGKPGKFRKYVWMRYSQCWIVASGHKWRLVENSSIACHPRLNQSSQLYLSCEVGSYPISNLRAAKRRTTNQSMQKSYSPSRCRRVTPCSFSHEHSKPWRAWSCMRQAELHQTTSRIQLFGHVTHSTFHCTCRRHIRLLQIRESLLVGSTVGIKAYGASANTTVPARTDAETREYLPLCCS